MIGEKVLIHLKGRAGQDVICDTRMEGKPLSVIPGNGTLLAPLEQKIADMAVGEHATVSIPAKYAYGEYDPNLVEVISESEIPNSENLPIGNYVVFETLGARIRVKVLKRENGNVYLDHNHELAGKDLDFEIDVVSMEKESAIERELHPAGCGCGCDRLKASLAS